MLPLTAPPVSSAIQVAVDVFAVVGDDVECRPQRDDLGIDGDGADAGDVARGVVLFGEALGGVGRGGAGENLGVAVGLA